MGHQPVSGMQSAQGTILGSFRGAASCPSLSQGYRWLLGAQRRGVGPGSLTGKRRPQVREGEGGERLAAGLTFLRGLGRSINSPSASSDLTRCLGLATRSAFGGGGVPRDGAG